MAQLIRADYFLSFLSFDFLAQHPGRLHGGNETTILPQRQQNSPQPGSDRDGDRLVPRAAARGQHHRTGPSHDPPQLTRLSWILRAPEDQPSFIISCSSSPQLAAAGTLEASSHLYRRHVEKKEPLPPKQTRAEWLLEGERLSGRLLIRGPVSLPPAWTLVNVSLHHSLLPQQLSRAAGIYLTHFKKNIYKGKKAAADLVSVVKEICRGGSR